jgi:hypothetical protein
MATEWQDLQKNVVNPGLKKAGMKERSVFETAIFGEAYEYVIVTPIASFAQYDDPISPLRKAIGEGEFRDYQTKSRRCVVSSHTYAELSRPDLSYMGKVASMTGPPKLAVVNSISVMPGRVAAFEDIVKTDIVPIMKKADVIGYFVNQSMFGGDGNAYTTIVFLDSFAELDKGSPFVRALGPAGAQKFLVKFGGGDRASGASSRALQPRPEHLTDALIQISRACGARWGRRKRRTTKKIRCTHLRCGSLTSAQSHCDERCFAEP